MRKKHFSLSCFVVTTIDITIVHYMSMHHSKIHHFPGDKIFTLFIQKSYLDILEQCCGTVTIYYGSGSGSDF
jgi:hypothetical protein